MYLGRPTVSIMMQVLSGTGKTLSLANVKAIYSPAILHLQNEFYSTIMQIENQNSDRPCAKNEKKKTSSGLIFKLHGRHTVDIPKAT